MRFESLRDLFLHELRDLYNAENQLVAALPRFVDAAAEPDLKKALRSELESVEERVTTLERIFGTLEEDPAGRKCHGMEGLIEEVDHVLEADTGAELRDLDLIAAVQRVAHCQMAGYGTPRTYADKLDQHQIADTLQGVLNEVGRLDEKLTRLARRVVHAREAVVTA